MEPSKANQSNGNDTTILSHHPYILCHFASYALCLLVVCIGGLWKAVGWVVLGVDCMLICMGSELCCGRLQCNEHGRYTLSRFSLASHTLSAQCQSLSVSGTQREEV